MTLDRDRRTTQSRSSRGLQRRLLIAGAVGAALSLVGLFLDPRAVLPVVPDGLHVRASASTLGCLALGMIHQLSGGAWGVVIRRPLGAATRVLPVLTLLFLPIALGMHAPLRVDARRRRRARRDPAAQAALPEHAVLPRPRGALLRWSGTRSSYFLNAGRSSRTAPAIRGSPRRMQLLSGGGLLAYGLTITFASFDWLMSLEPHWFSTIYGVLIMGGQGLTALAFLIVVLVWLSRRPPLDRHRRARRTSTISAT